MWIAEALERVVPGGTIKTILSGKVDAGGEVPSQQTSIAIDEANNAIVVHAIRDAKNVPLTEPAEAA